MGGFLGCILGHHLHEVNLRKINTSDNCGGNGGCFTAQNRLFLHQNEAPFPNGGEGGVNYGDFHTTLRFTVFLYHFDDYPTSLG